MIGVARLRCGELSATLPWRGRVGAPLGAPGWGDPTTGTRCPNSPHPACRLALWRSASRDPPPPGEGGSAWHEAGFTLVELLVALTLLSFVSLALFGALRFGITAWVRGSAHVERAEDVAFVQGFLRRLIADAYPLFLSNDPTRPHVDFEGTAGSLSLLGPAPIAIARGGRSRFALSVDRHHGRADLVMASRPELAAHDDASASIRKVLLAGVQTVEFSYFGRGRSDRAAQWRNSWVGELTMPALVRVQVRFAADDARLWPDLVLAPRIAVDVGCVYDTLTGRCRGR